MEKPKIILSLFFSKIRELESLRKGYYDMEKHFWFIGTGYVSC